MLRRNSRLLPAMLGLAAEAASVACASGREAAGSRHLHRSQPAHLTQTAPDVTGTVASPPSTNRPLAAQGEAPKVEVLVPYFLPNAPRARVRACGETWHNKKMAGQTGDDDWRDFASKCLAATAPPS